MVWKTGHLRSEVVIFGLFSIIGVFLLPIQKCIADPSNERGFTAIEEPREEPRSLHLYRLVVSPTAHPLPQDAGYFTDTWIIWPSVTITPLSHFSVTGGMIVWPFPSNEIQYSPGAEGSLGQLDDDGAFGIFYIAPRLAIDLSQMTSIAVVATNSRINSNRRGQALSGLVSYGGLRTNATFGLSYVRQHYASGESRSKSNILMTLGGYWQCDGSVALVFESHLPLSSDALLQKSLLIVAVRFFGEDISLDVAAMGIPSDLDEGEFLPLITFGYAFGK
jgi:hypothetical protein